MPSRYDSLEPPDARPHYDGGVTDCEPDEVHRAWDTQAFVRDCRTTRRTSERQRGAHTPRRRRAQARRPRCTTLRSSARSGDSGEDDPDPEPAGLLAAFTAATPHLTGADRLALFLRWPDALKQAAWTQVALAAEAAR